MNVRGEWVNHKKYLIAFSAEVHQWSCKKQLVTAHRYPSREG